jgi:hypothetical protein
VTTQTITTADRLEIDELAARYNLAIDLGDPAGWVACFSPDGELAIGEVGPRAAANFGLAEGRWRGPAELLAFATAVTSGRRFRHWSYNRVLTAAGDGIESVSYMNVYYLDQPAGQQLATGIMRDRLIETGGGWHYASRRISFDR